MADITKNRIEIEMSNGYKLVAERNSDPQYDHEIFVGVVDADGVWSQDLAIIRNSYHYDGDELVWDDERFDVLVYGDKDREDYTDSFTIGLYQSALQRQPFEENDPPVIASAFWCKHQCKDDDGIFCDAHIAEGRTFNCPYGTPEDRLKAEYPCSDYKANKTELH